MNFKDNEKILQTSKQSKFLTMEKESDKIGLEDRDSSIISVDHEKKNDCNPGILSPAMM